MKWRRRVNRVLADDVENFRAGGNREFAKFFEGIFHGPPVVTGSFQTDEERALAGRLLNFVHLQLTEFLPMLHALKDAFDRN